MRRQRFRRRPASTRRPRGSRARGCALGRRAGVVAVDVPVRALLPLSLLRARRVHQLGQVVARLGQLELRVVQSRFGEIRAGIRRLSRRLRLLRRHRQLAHDLRRRVQLVLHVRPDLRGDHPRAFRLVRRELHVHRRDLRSKHIRVLLRRPQLTLRGSVPRNVRRQLTDPREQRDDRAQKRDDDGGRRQGQHELAAADPPGRSRQIQSEPSLCKRREVWNADAGGAHSLDVPLLYLTRAVLLVAVQENRLVARDRERLHGPRVRIRLGVFPLEAFVQLRLELVGTGRFARFG
mmetsp:Transcript_7010/g.31676  ORF Transcript_7010/g.31676 Transcript_7010/m.31676 type:complete len:292 (-) Transcript_7010:928-1803(-)